VECHTRSYPSTVVRHHTGEAKDQERR